MIDKETVRTQMDEMKVKGNQLVGKVKEIIEEGNVRRVTIRKEGRTLLEFPLSVGVGGATAAVFLMPTMAAVGARAALVTDVEVIGDRIAEEVQDGEVEEVETETECPYLDSVAFHSKLHGPCSQLNSDGGTGHSPSPLFLLRTSCPPPTSSRARSIKLRSSPAGPWMPCPGRLSS